MSLIENVKRKAERIAGRNPNKDRMRKNTLISIKLEKMVLAMKIPSLVFPARNAVIA